MKPLNHLRLELAAGPDGAELRVWPDDGPPAVVIVPTGETMPCELWGVVRDLVITDAGKPSVYLFYDWSFRAGTIRY